MVTIETVNGKSIWLMKKRDISIGIGNFDVFSGERVFSTKNDKVITPGVVLISEDDFQQYLIAYEQIQSNYTKDEVEEIFNQVKQDFYTDREDNIKMKK